VPNIGVTWIRSTLPAKPVGNTCAAELTELGARLVSSRANRVMQKMRDSTILQRRNPAPVSENLHFLNAQGKFVW